MQVARDHPVRPGFPAGAQVVGAGKAVRGRGVDPLAVAPGPPGREPAAVHGPGELPARRVHGEQPLARGEHHQLRCDQGLAEHRGVGGEPPADHPLLASRAYQCRSADGTNSVRPSRLTPGRRYTGPNRARQSRETLRSPRSPGTRPATSPLVDAATTTSCRPRCRPRRRPRRSRPARTRPRRPACTDPGSRSRHCGRGSPALAAAGPSPEARHLVRPRQLREPGGVLGAPSQRPVKGPEVKGTAPPAKPASRPRPR
jgi:hypothetical protein